MTERRRQADRTAATQARLVDAAIDSLVEHGWAATTAVEVCRRADVTRGALNHHFPSLSALLAAALQHLCDEAAAAPGREVRALVDVVDELWTRVSTPRFKAILEAWLATANDPELRPELQRVMVAFSKLVSADQLAGSKVLGRKAARDFYLLARETMLGLALGRATNAGPLAHEALVLTQLRSIARAIDAERKLR